MTSGSMLGSGIRGRLRNADRAGAEREIIRQQQLLAGIVHRAAEPDFAAGGCAAEGSEAEGGWRSAIANEGDDAANGSSATPWQTLQYAASQVDAGDGVIVRAGTYDGFIMGWDSPGSGLFGTNSGTAQSPITFRAEPGVIINARNVQTNDGINLEGANFIVIEGFGGLGQSDDVVDDRLRVMAAHPGELERLMVDQDQRAVKSQHAAG